MNILGMVWIFWYQCCQKQ